MNAHIYKGLHKQEGIALGEKICFSKPLKKQPEVALANCRRLWTAKRFRREIALSTNCAPAFPYHATNNKEFIFYGAGCTLMRLPPAAICNRFWHSASQGGASRPNNHLKNITTAVTTIFATKSSEPTTPAPISVTV